jgi:hypothetical protein
MCHGRVGEVTRAFLWCPARSAYRPQRRARSPSVYTRFGNQLRATKTNRTCRSPASGSRTRSHVFTHNGPRPSCVRRTSRKCPQSDLSADVAKMMDAAQAAEAFRTEMSRRKGCPCPKILDRDDPGIGPRRPQGKPVLDGLSGPGAHQLAAMIRQHWKGSKIEIEISPVPGAKGEYQIRSNLKEGLPVGG